MEGTDFLSGGSAQGPFWIVLGWIVLGPGPLLKAGVTILARNAIEACVILLGLLDAIGAYAASGTALLRAHALIAGSVGSRRPR